MNIKNTIFHTKNHEYNTTYLKIVPSRNNLTNSIKIFINDHTLFYYNNFYLQYNHIN